MNADDLPRKADGVVYIYALHDPVSGELRYIGKTVDPRARLGQHIRGVDRGRATHVKLWVKGLLARGLQPLMRVVEACCPVTWQDRERACIAEHRGAGARLTNTAAGGNEPHRTTEDCRAGAKAVNSSPDAKLHNLMRYMSAAARSKRLAGDTNRAALYSHVVSRVRSATGASRAALREYAESKGF